MHVIVTCADRKSRPVPSSFRLRAVTSLGLDASSAVKSWASRLEDDRAASVEARALYAGEHWDIVRQIDKQTHAEESVAIWVCSAGYGLIPIDAPLRPYSATFSLGHPDTVPGGRNGLSAWWAALADWSGPAPGPRSVCDLVRSVPQARVLLALSVSYISAVREDLHAAADIAVDGAVSIISAGTRALGELQDLLLPTDARLQASLGGTRQSLNARIAAHLLASGLRDHSEMYDHLVGLLEHQPPLPTFMRRRMDDAEVYQFIRHALKRDPNASHTRLLRSLRASGMACEQGRFAALFADEVARKR